MLADSRFSLTTFSPSGKLVQIEHALAAVAGGTTSLGIKGALNSLEGPGRYPADFAPRVS
jgi:hypothetical protein